MAIEDVEEPDAAPGRARRVLGTLAGGGHRRWVNADGTPAVWRPAGSDADDDVSTPPMGIPVIPAHHRPRWWRDHRHDPDLHRPLPSWGVTEPPAEEPAPTPEPPPVETPSQRVPRKLTVTRVAAMRSREITENGIRAFHRAATADGADRSGLTSLTYITMMSYALDAAIAVALANTLFFAAATAESKTNVALYLAITVAPFALVAPVIGPLLDRLQRGRRAALAVSFGGRAVLAVVMAFGYDSWALYPAALGAMVLSKSFVVLKAAVTPRVLPRRSRSSPRTPGSPPSAWPRAPCSAGSRRASRRCGARRARCSSRPPWVSRVHCCVS